MMHDRLETLQTLMHHKLVPLFYHADVDVAFSVAKACYDGGARVLEYTNRGYFAHEVFSALQKRVLRELPDLRLGIGSVQDAGTAALYIQLGAAFVVTPFLREDVVRTCHRRKVPVIPGVATGTEIGQAEEWGVEIVKLMPGEVLGPAFVKAHLAPCPWTKMMISGGVSPDEANLRGWFEAGAVCVGMGSKLISAAVLAQQDWATLTQNVQKAIQLVQKVTA